MWFRVISTRKGTLPHRFSFSQVGGYPAARWRHCWRMLRSQMWYLVSIDLEVTISTGPVAHAYRLCVSLVVCGCACDVIVVRRLDQWESLDLVVCVDIWWTRGYIPLAPLECVCACLCVCVHNVCQHLNLLDWSEGLCNSLCWHSWWEGGKGSELRHKVVPQRF